MGEIEARCLDSSGGDKGTSIGNTGRISEDPVSEVR